MAGMRLSALSVLPEPLGLSEPLGPLGPAATRAGQGRHARVPTWKLPGEMMAMTKRQELAAGQRALEPAFALAVRALAPKARVPAVSPSATRVQQAPPDAPHHEGCAPAPHLLAMRFLAGLGPVLVLVPCRCRCRCRCRGW
ncbi:MAG: hypothetical protein IPJ48_09375 [Propionivibrio sp.]|uniref:Uncharacterized protein n=1 Tax=Candidatus Propionivibrio dominans TaxID=2954373 RepID=A0A9D7FK06_9RHOO|nr:hypothetical protein [Candidatus Propionivibrio dominans]